MSGGGDGAVIFLYVKIFERIQKYYADAQKEYQQFYGRGASLYIILYTYITYI